MKKIKTIFLSVMVIVFVGCAAGGVIKYNKSTDFSKYKMYAWDDHLHDPDKDEGDFNLSYVEQRRKSEIARMLRYKGFQEFKSEFGITSDPDFLIVIETLVSHNTKTVDHHREQAMRIEGSLSLSFVDAKTKEVIWKTWSIGVLYEPDNPKNEVSQTLKEILEALEQFPPTSKG